MKNFRELLVELEVLAVSPVAGKKQLNEDARQETVQYISKMKEAFGDMEDETMSSDNAQDLGGEEVSDEPKEEKSMEERVAELEAKVAALEAKDEPKA